jgi:hypothetical protein
MMHLGEESYLIFSNNEPTLLSMHAGEGINLFVNLEESHKVQLVVCDQVIDIDCDAK